jgi:uncharacterized protein (DUF2062 family)
MIPRKKNKFFRFLKLSYLKLFRINDTPQKIALGFGIGIFLGIMPGTGLLAAIGAAFVLRVNRASALLGSLLVNTWINVATFIFAIKIGAAVTGTDWQQIYADSYLTLKGFHFMKLLKLSLPKIILPIVIGFFIIGLCAGLISYIIVLMLFKGLKKRKQRENIIP